ncbi:MAG TPA: hypothetical protein VHT24_07535 [Pseudacidobacterium sp.]|jgi:hypothetical protein|nr:hypothetical protein [Pseudacidobacterium sp.]
MAIPSRTTVTIDGNKFNAYSVSFGITTDHEGKGMPLMGTGFCSIDIHVDANDNINIPFPTLKALFDMANIATTAKIKDIKIEFWQDDSKTNAVCVYSFQGWISHFNINSQGEGNHVLALSLQPALGKNQMFEINMGN